MTQRLRNRLTVEFIILAALVGVVLGYYIPEVLAKRSAAYEFIDPINDIRSALIRHYVDEPDHQALQQGAIGGMLDVLADPYTTYFTAEQLEGFEKHTRGTFSGIGAEIDKSGDYIAIVSPLEDSPAFKAGIVAGDVILAVDGESIKGYSTEEAVKKITGPEGTEVTLTLRRADGKEEDITVTRGRITIQTVKGVKRDDAGHWDYLLDPVDRVGYIRMTQFSEPTAEALQAAIAELEAAGVKGLILDLRYNPGGLLESAIAIADMFLDEGTIVSTRGRRSPERAWTAEQGGAVTELPVLVMINEASASASEILAGALKYNDRAIVLGTRSVGKGSVQQIIPLEGGSGGIKLTTSLYYMPNGQNIHRKEGAERWGVDPSDGFYVAITPEQRDAMLEQRRANGVEKPADGGEVTPQWIEEELADPQLAAALKTMEAKLTKGEWAKVGPGNAVVLTHLSDRQALARQRDRYQDRLDEIHKELARLDKIIAGAQPPTDDDQAAHVEDHVNPDDPQPAEVPAEQDVEAVAPELQEAP